jgi:hypothetical protein
LQEAIDGNFPGGRDHDGAMAETQRREAERDRATQLRWIKAAYWASVIGTALSIAVTAVTSD